METKTSELKIQSFKLKDIVPAAYNPRTMSDNAFGGLTKSITRFGCLEPIIVNVRDGRNTIVGGHQRYRVLLKLHGDEYECPCVIVDLGDEDERLLNLVLNNPHIQGEFFDKLPEYIDELRAQLTDQQLYVDMQLEALRGEIESQMPNFMPGDQNPRLDLLEPLMMKCPHCGEKFNARDQM